MELLVAQMIIHALCLVLVGISVYYYTKWLIPGTDIHPVAQRAAIGVIAFAIFCGLLFFLRPAPPVASLKNILAILAQTAAFELPLLLLYLFKK